MPLRLHGGNFSENGSGRFLNTLMQFDSLQPLCDGWQFFQDHCPGVGISRLSPSESIGPREILAESPERIGCVQETGQPTRSGRGHRLLASPRERLDRVGDGPQAID